MRRERAARTPARRYASVGDFDTMFRRSAAGDPGARESIILSFLPYAYRLAHRYAGRGEPVDDLRQIATIGLIKAVDRYEPERCASFIAFAEPTILGELRRHFRDEVSPVHVPRSLQECAQKVARAHEQLLECSGSEPTARMIAEHLDVEVSTVAEGQSALHARWPASLDERRPTEDGQRLALGETVGEEDPEYERIDTSLRWSSALRELAARERRVILLRFGCELTQSEIGRRIGVSQMHVSRIIRSATAALATALEPQ